MNKRNAIYKVNKKTAAGIKLKQNRKGGGVEIYVGGKLEHRLEINQGDDAGTLIHDVNGDPVAVHFERKDGKIVISLGKVWDFLSEEFPVCEHEIFTFSDYGN